MAEIDLDAILRNNRRISIQMEQRANKAIAKEGLSAVQAHILLYILSHSDQGTSLTAIHREFQYSMAALSGILKRLKEKDYVRVEHCATDDRYKLLFATEKGKQLQQSLDASIRSVQNQLYHCFSMEELVTFDHLQRKLLQKLSTLREEPQKEVSTS